MGKYVASTTYCCAKDIDYFAANCIMAVGIALVLGISLSYWLRFELLRTKILRSQERVKHCQDKILEILNFLTSFSIV